MIDRIVVDCDTGIDDALALLYLTGVGAPIAAIGSVHGNTDASSAALNTLRVLEVVGVDVPVAVGAERALVAAAATERRGAVHGADGLGGAAGPAPATVPVRRSAAEQLVLLARRRGVGTLLATGPLTNLALALHLEPRLPERVGCVVVMGGALEHPGNVSATAEANVSQDPEAAAAVFAAPWNVVLVPLDATSRAVLAGDELARIERSPTAASRFAARILRHYVGVYERRLGYRGCLLHDPLAAVVAVEPARAAYRETAVAVEIAGPLRGTTRSVESGRKLRVVDGFDAEYAVRAVVDAIAGAAGA